MTFLQEVKKKSPKLYFFFLIFLGFTFISHLFRTSSTPFFFYGMYSSPVPVTDDFSFLIVEKNGKEIFNKPEIWNHHRRVPFYYSSRTYEQLLNNDYMKIHQSFHTKIYPDKSALQDYPKWLLRYLERLEGEKIDSITLYKVTVSYEQNEKPQLKNVKKIFTEHK